MRFSFSVIALSLAAVIGWIGVSSDPNKSMEDAKVYVSLYEGEGCSTAPLTESGIMTTDTCTRVNVDGVHFYYRLTCETSTNSSSWSGSVFLDKMCEIKLSSLSGDDACTCVSASVRDKSGSVRVNCGSTVPAVCS